MTKMSFGTAWVEKIMLCITSTSYSVRINGNVERNFNSTRGLRQGDAFSLSCFFLYAKGLSVLMRLAIENGDLKGVRVSRRGLSVGFIKQLLQEYEECLGQKVNYDKSTIFFSSNISEKEKVRLALLIGMHISYNSKNYLGLPNMVGRRKI